jgi:hypothetical protein
VAWVTIAEAAQALGVSQDTISRRRKAGEIPAQQESIPSGFRWLVEIDDDLAGALGKPEGADAGEHAAGQPAPAVIEELAKLRAERDGLERLLSEISAERDDWKERHAQEQRASAEARRLAETAQRIAEAAQAEAAQARQLPASVSDPAQPMPEASTSTGARQGAAESFSARLRRWLMGGTSQA